MRLTKCSTLWGREVAYNFNHSTEHIARVVGGFAAGSIANLDRNNPKEKNQGRRVEIGVRVSMERLWIVCVKSKVPCARLC